MDLKQAHIETILAQAGNRTDDVKTGAVSTPIYLTTAYRHAGLGQSTGYDYSRETNPTRDVLQQTLAQLEDGAGAFALSSGMAAIQLAFQRLKPVTLLWFLMIFTVARFGSLTSFTRTMGSTLSCGTVRITIG